MSDRACLYPHPIRCFGTRPPVVRLGSEGKRDPTMEAAIDDALGMTFPASDPPAWGCLSRRRSEPDER